MKRALILFILITLIPHASALQEISIPSYGWRNTTTQVHIYLDTTFFKNSSFSIQDVMGSTDSLVFEPGRVPYHGSYSFNVTYHDLTLEDHIKLVNFLQVHLTLSTGYELNISTTPVSFSEILGYSYNADEMINWIAENLWDGDDSGYNLFLLNLEELDNMYPHWFEIKPVDIDSGIYTDKFFSGTSGLFGGKQVSAWGGVSIPIHFVDISSYVWYGEFVNNVWNNQYVDDTLVHKVQDFNDRGTGIYLGWLQRMVQPFFTYLFSNRISTQVIVDDYNIPIKVLVNRSSDLQEDWVISESKMEQVLNSSFQFLDFNINSDWEMLDEYPNLQSIIKKYTKYDTVKKINYIELSEGFLNWLEYDFLDDKVGTPLNNQIPSLIFFLDDLDFRWYGTSISGLGGMGWQFQVMSRDRFYTDGVQSRGFSQVLLHEIGHSLGLYHPFRDSLGEQKNLWITDFTASIVGYYSSYPSFSIYDKDALARLYADNFIIQADYTLKAASDVVDSGERAIGRAAVALADAISFYDSKNYVNAIECAKDTILFANSRRNEIVIDKSDMSNSVTSVQEKFSISPAIMFVPILVLLSRKKWKQ